MRIIRSHDDHGNPSNNISDYPAYLARAGHRFPPNAWNFARASWHYNFLDSRCPHDARVEAVQIVESVTNDAERHRRLGIHVRLLGAYQDGWIGLAYDDVSRYSFAASATHSRHSIRGHGDWLIDEIRLTKKKRVLHEISFEYGEWRIECADLRYTWTAIPGAEREDTSTTSAFSLAYEAELEALLGPEAFSPESSAA